MSNTIFRDPRIVGLLALIAGLILGLVLFWGIFPPQAVDVPPALLQKGYRDYYLGFVANEYAQTHNLTQAQTELGVPKDWSPQSAAAALRDLAKSPSRTDNAQLTALAASLSPSATAPAPAPGLNWPALCSGLFILALLIIGVAVLLPRLRGAGVSQPAPAAVRTGQSSKAVEPTTTWAGAAEKPLAQFVTTYEIGDDRYDTSFSIETPNGDFLGECGVGIGESIGVGNPDKVTAFEVWLFDKNDIRTVTKVLMSEFAYGDQSLRAKLAPKGEPELARPNAVVELETATLKVNARVIEMEYGTGELEPRSFFNKLQLELAAWPKDGATPAGTSA